MNIKIAMIATAVGAVSSASTADETPMAIPQVLPESVASEYADYVHSETALQELFMGSGNERTTQVYLGHQTTYGHGDQTCETPIAMKKPLIVCSTYRLVGDHNELVYTKGLDLSGELVLGKTTYDLRSKSPNYYYYDWYKFIEEAPIDGSTDWHFELGQTGEDELALNVTVPLFEQAFTYRNGKTITMQYGLGPAEIPSTDQHVWCLLSVVPVCPI
eukprot:Clim_evm118s11 gene=Clim_evmTU118s11